MKNTSTNFFYSWKKDRSEKNFKTGVSLHGHTWHSHESLSFLPGITKKISPVRKILRWTEARYEKKWHHPFDYAKGYWTSPVSPQGAYDLEAKQITDRGLRPLVSITDHDSIDACKELSEESSRSIPTSLEWTVPYEGAVLHMGVHNIPATKGIPFAKKLRAYTENPKPKILKNILEEIHSLPHALLILNHPLSDQGRIGFEIHESLLNKFLAEHKAFVHALEANALQSWDINRRVSRIAEKISLPIVSGGDRHGFEPNGAINLTDAETFDEFAHEIRHEKKSNVLFMPQCKKSLTYRYAENVASILRDYPDLPGRVSWHDRIFYECPDGITRPLAAMFNAENGAAKVTDYVIKFLGVATRIVKPISPVMADPNTSMVSQRAQRRST